MSERADVYVTKYSLTKGVFKLNVRVADRGMVIDDSTNYQSYYHGKDWHYSKEDAIARAEEMRKKKLISLKNQIEKIKKLDFNA